MKTYGKMTVTLLCFIFIFLNLQAANDFKSKRTVTKSFTVNPNSTLMVSNEYGTINITEWDKNEISFEVTITATAKKQADADQIVNTVNVEFANESGNVISAKTIYKNLRNCNCSRTVDYQIMVPKNIHYQLKNEYGNIVMGNAKGNVSTSIEYGNFTAANLSGKDNHIKIEYGNLNVGQLLGTTNTVNVEYGNNLVISTSNNLDVQIEYSKMKIGTVDNLNIKSEYSEVSVQKAKTMTVKSEYEKYRVGDIDVLNGKFEYTNIDIQQLNKGIPNLSIQYGKFSVQNVSPQFDAVNIKSAYTPIEMKIDATASYNVDLRTDYSNVSIPEGKNNVTKTSRDNVATAKGIVGANASPKAVVNIKAEYASIKLK